MPAGHSHAHHDRTAAPASPRVRRALVFALAPLALLTLVALVVLWPGDPQVDRAGLGLPEQLARGTVTDVKTVPCSVGEDPAGEEPPGEGAAGGEFENEADAECAQAQVRITRGPGEGERVTLVVTRSVTSIDVREGSKLVLAYEPDAPEQARYRLVDVQRGRPLLLLGVLFAGAVVALGRWKGLAALGGLAVSFVVLTSFALPALVEGANPLPVAITASAAIMFAALYLSHGFSARTSTAVLGTLVSLLLTGVLAAVFVGASRLSGLGTEEATFLGATSGRIDLQGLLLAGIIIGSLGVLDDVTVTQASAVWELRAANPGYGFRELYRAGVRIGRDHIASTVNTLVLAYAGASLPLLLLFTLADRPLGDALTSEVVAQELVRTLVGSVGLVASVPVTTALAALVAGGGLRDPAAVRPASPDTEGDWIGELRESWGDDDDETLGTWRSAPGVRRRKPPAGPAGGRERTGDDDGGGAEP